VKQHGPLTVLRGLKSLQDRVALPDADELLAVVVKRYDTAT
jgi:hypothetical protein